MPRRIYIFDFDLTITKRHTGGFAGSKSEITEKFILKNLKPGFTEVVKEIYSKNYGLYIASHGDENTKQTNLDLVAGAQLILKYMETLFGEKQKYFTCPVFDQEWNMIKKGNILSRYTYDKKQYHLESILSMEEIGFNDKKAKKNIFFVDDDPVNLKNYHENGCQVMNFEDFEIAAQQAKSESVFLNFPIF